MNENKRDLLNEHICKHHSNPVEMKQTENQQIDKPHENKRFKQKVNKKKLD